DDRGLGMVRSSPGTRAALVGRNGDALLALIGHLEDVGQGRCTAAADATRSPGTRLPRGKLPVLVGGDLDTRIAGRPHTRNFLFGIAFEHDLHRLAASSLRQLRAGNAPA